MLLFIGLLIMLVMYVFAGGLSGGGIALFVDLPSAIVILVPLAFFLAATKSGKIFGSYIKSSFTMNYKYTKQELESISSAAKHTVRFILGLSGFGFLIGIIATLAHLDSTEYWGPNLAISLITVLYSITLAFFVFFPVQAWAKNKAALSR